LFLAENNLSDGYFKDKPLNVKEEIKNCIYQNSFYEPGYGHEIKAPEDPMSIVTLMEKALGIQNKIVETVGNDLTI